VLEAGVSQEEIPRLYGRIAPFYDFWAAGTEGRARRVCLERARVRDGESILEVAVGTGLAFRELVRANPSGVTEGVDLTEQMLDRARLKVAGLPGQHRLRVGDARHLDFADGTFELLVNAYMFDLLAEADFAPVLAEFRRVLKPGGRLAVVNMAVARGPSHQLYGLMYRLSPRLLGGCRGVALGPFLEAAGFVDVEVEVVSQLGFPSEVVTARLPGPEGQGPRR
jgi:ubiquinone/menaquinone biosynthesis C-methylase UbiE